LPNGCVGWLARAFFELLKRDVETLRKELSAIQNPEKRVRALGALADLCSVLGLEA
jgi:hypothetical protein